MRLKIHSLELFYTIFILLWELWNAISMWYEIHVICEVDYDVKLVSCNEIRWYEVSH
jgi:hypothetical protein